VVNETRALLLTDVVDSTKLSEELGDVRMAEVWSAHDRVARDLLRVHGGLEIDKTDGFLMLFEHADQAVEYAVAYHRAIGRLDPPLMARVGLHVGPVILTRNQLDDVARGAKPLEVAGLAKPIAARVMSVAGGGQTLLTREAREALTDSPHRAESHGHWRMKGVSKPMELIEVGGEGAPFTPPPDTAKVYRVVEKDGLWVPIREVVHSLPAERDAFVGRQADLDTLARRLDGDARLVSVLGIGGTGKTRLVTRYGWSWLGDYPGGVWFCDLSEARGVDGICHGVARALDVPLGNEDPVIQLGHAIAGRGRCLVLQDNFEQVAGYAGDTLGVWLDQAGEAQFVVTTRELLGLPGEEALALAPLPTSDGAALFVARARSAKRDFEPDDVASIDALVKVLDGLPLAIELAAARVRVMPPAKLLGRMSERFKLLTSSGGRRDRQATLRATLDWSWELLSADEQAALAQVSVFEGGFTLEAAEAVLTLDEAWPMDAVQALVDKSLVRQVAEDRFDLLVSVQQYAAQQLDASGGRADAEVRHGALFAICGTYEAIDALDRPGRVTLRRALTLELNNLVAASRRAVARRDGAVAVSTLRGAWEVLSLRGPYGVAAGLAAEVLGLELAPVDRARAARCCGMALVSLGRMDEAPAYLDAALTLAREVGDHRLEGSVLRDLGGLHQHQGRMDEARVHYDAALTLAREIGDRRLEGTVLGNLGNTHQNLGRMDEARAHYDAALTVVREIGDRRFEGITLGNLGNLHQHQGRIDEARAYYDAALTLAREVGNRRSEGTVLGNLGYTYQNQGRTDEARAHFDAALTVVRETGNRRAEGTVLGNLGNLHQNLGQLDASRAHYDAALTVIRETGNRRSEGIVLGNLGSLHQHQGRMDEARVHYDSALTVAREVGNRRFEGVTLGKLAGLHQDQGRMDEARAHYDAALTVIRETGNRRSEGIVLASMGSLDQKQGGMDEARGHYDAALTIFREIGDRGFEGILLGWVAELCLVQGRQEEVRGHLAEGERLLREVTGAPEDLGGLLCTRARLEQADGAHDAARATLAEAESIAASVGARPGSEFGLNLARTRTALATGH
jgi:predicted ATPase/class 3 adenylate cyclase/Tfp pilus assembly protein PilF